MSLFESWVCWWAEPSQKSVHEHSAHGVSAGLQPLTSDQQSLCGRWHAERNTWWRPDSLSMQSRLSSVGSVTVFLFLKKKTKNSFSQMVVKVSDLHFFWQRIFRLFVKYVRLRFLAFFLWSIFQQSPAFQDVSSSEHMSLEGIIG